MNMIIGNVWKGCEGWSTEGMGRRARWKRPEVELVESIRLTWFVEAGLESV